MYKELILELDKYKYFHLLYLYVSVQCIYGLFDVFVGLSCVDLHKLGSGV